MGLFSKLSYDPRRDLRPVTQLIESPALVVVPNNRSYHDFPALVDAAGKQTLAYASQGVGTGGQLFGTLLSAKIGAPMTHVAYRGSTPGLADVISGQVDFMYDAIPTSGVYAKAGKLRALAIGSEARSALFPEVPTLKELGYASIVPTFWWGVAVKAGTPEPVVAKLHDAIVAAITDPEVAAKFTGQGVLVKTSSPDEFAAYIDSEISRWTPIMKEAGMSAQ
ncbi:Bug family tripartite tricarboxylate transporter substrate binding protein [Bordetella holmesii]|uniref:Tripartite tricarboxylate transporter receptor family protein n=2 Tax=Bordetella holmesii TaxID=35814 RepID=A0ABN0RZG8_9BORD|nr:tripartite tricarboxylate transporter substrate binding protein [Bordetella holmesii]AHV93713.1 tripartite tricarboxylate transporter receptor family protein [Bordetella holmesii ATCC 51541]AIT24843.1 tripartite tricarboxylate transporter receptor family protein [Bordetella holmesii 44057]EWM45414.1 tripartite tricarboxylate transporter receptor family protein [Bordetella holmesii 70147]EWM48205.1 tripartite tricarboxylate transporter receptor family protein [Bordetella holmesii 41130]EWM49